MLVQSDNSLLAVGLLVAVTHEEVAVPALKDQLGGGAIKMGQTGLQY